MKIAIVGATGLVGGEILKVLAKSSLSEAEVIAVASEKSVGKTVDYQGKQIPVVNWQSAVAAQPEFAIFSAGGNTSLELAPKFAEAGITVIDNSSAWRMNPHHKLIVPEINAKTLTREDKIIANPNCSTIQMVLALHMLHRHFHLKRIVVSTYQSVTGTGVKAVKQLEDERKGIMDGPKAYPYPIDLNVLPHIDSFLDNGYTKEEMKMVNETRKILGDNSIGITATTVRVPAMGGHSESVNVEFDLEFDIHQIYEILDHTPGVIVLDDPSKNIYPMPILAQGKNEVFVGRIRRDESKAKTINMWIVADNLRKGAATNAVQIAEYLAAHNLV